MRVSFVLAVSLLALLGACERPDVATVDTIDAPIESAAAPAASAKRLPLPNCNDVAPDIDAGGEITHKDCRGMLPGDLGLAYEARYTPKDDGVTEVTVQIVGPGDAGLQTIAEQMEGSAAQPSVNDVDGDGRVDLLLPLLSGNVNTNWAVWRGLPDGAFSRAGEFSGVDIARSKDGYIAVSARSGANIWNVHFYTVENDKLALIATAEAAIELTGPDGKSRKTCSIVDTSGLDTAHLSPIQAEKTFCMDPVVSRIFS
jgi:hypothetical protein